jgi:hypothetical protein
MPKYDSLFELKAAKYEKNILESEHFELKLSWVTWNGDKFCYGSIELELENFQGTKEISKLSAYPLEYHSSPDDLKNRLISRGKRFVELKGIHHKAYIGPGDIYEHVVKEGRYGPTRSATKASRAVGYATATNGDVLSNHKCKFSSTNAL